MRGIDLLKTGNIPFGILSVVTDESANYYKEIYDFFKNLDAKTVDFIPSYLPGASQELNVSPTVWGEFLINIYRIWIHDLSFEIVYLSNLIKKMQLISLGKNYHNTSILCELTDQCGNNLSVTSDASLYFCECLIGLPEYFLGNLLESNMQKLLNTSKTSKTQKNLNIYDTNCQNCHIHSVCEGGCLKHRIHGDNTVCTSKDYFCISKQKITDYIKKDLFT